MQISRSTKVGGGTTLTSNTLARAVDIETDMLNLYTNWNAHDAGTSKWQVVSVENSSSTPLVINNSTGTNDIVDFRDNGTSVFKISDGGRVTITGALLLTSSDGLHTYQLTINSDGELQQEQIS